MVAEATPGVGAPRCQWNLAAKRVGAEASWGPQRFRGAGAGVPGRRERRRGRRRAGGRLPGREVRRLRREHRAARGARTGCPATASSARGRDLQAASRGGFRGKGPRAARFRLLAPPTAPPWQMRLRVSSASAGDDGRGAPCGVLGGCGGGSRPRCSVALGPVLALCPRPSRSPPLGPPRASLRPPSRCSPPRAAAEAPRTRVAPLASPSTAPARAPRPCPHARLPSFFSKTCFY